MCLFEECFFILPFSVVAKLIGFDLTEIPVFLLIQHGEEDWIFIAEKGG